MCVIVYPAAVMLLQTLLLGEYTLRKFFFYRLLSVRVLVDFEAPAVYNTWWVAMSAIALMATT